GTNVGMAMHARRRLSSPSTLSIDSCRASPLNSRRLPAAPWENLLSCPGPPDAQWQLQSPLMQLPRPTGTAAPSSAYQEAAPACHDVRTTLWLQRPWAAGAGSSTRDWAFALRIALHGR